MATRPKNRKKVENSEIDMGTRVPSPIATLGRKVGDLLHDRQSKKYQEKLKDMGMFEDAGGRRNVPPKKKSTTDKIETSPRPKKRPSRASQTVRRANRIKEMIEKEAVGLRDKTPLVPIKEPTGDPVREFTLGGDVRHNTNRGKTY